MLNNRSIALLVALVFALAAPPALAHTGVHLAGGLAAGFAHPFLGPDHVLAMLSVGALGAAIGGRAMWTVPASFMVVMAAGAGLAFAGQELAYAETAIALSLVVFGGLVASRAGLSTSISRGGPGALIAGVVGVFALFHGYAHGAELPALAGQAPYAAGFLAATALLHGTGIVLTRLAAASGPLAQASLRAGGVAVAIAGLTTFLA